MAPIQWDDAAKLQLLLRVIEYGDTKLSQQNWAAIANAMGDGVTASAVSQKFYKLKKESERLSALTPITPTKDAAPKTPRKRKTKDDATDTPTPTKKRSGKENGIKISTEPVVKSESAGQSDFGVKTGGSVDQQSED